MYEWDKESKKREGKKDVDKNWKEEKEKERRKK